MRILHVLIATALLLSVSITACTPGTTGRTIAESERPVICAIMPLTGHWAIVGEQGAIGLEAAARDYNAQLIMEDDHYDPKQTVTAARKLIAQGCTSLLVPFIENALPIAEIAREHDVPVNLMYDGTVHVENDPILYTSGFSVEGAGHLMAEYVKKTGADTAVVVRDQNDFSITLTDAFVEQYDGELLDVITITADEDFRTLVTKINVLDPEAIYFGFALSDDIAFVRTLKEQGIDARLYSTTQFTKDKIAKAGSAAEGLCQTDLPPVDVFQDATIPAWAALGYDAGVAAVHGDWDSLVFESISGGVVDMNGEPRSEVIYCVENGVPVLQ